MVDVLVIALLVGASVSGLVMVVFDVLVLRALHRVRFCECGWISIPEGWDRVHDHQGVWMVHAEAGVPAVPGVPAVSRPRLLDLFCGAGGCSVGYARAGFDVVGVDINPQPRYPFEFHQGDAMTWPLDGFDVVHASPPCQAYSVASASRRAAGIEYADLLAATRARLQAAGVHWVIENVPRAPLRPDIKLCGCMFGLELRRERWFETSWRWFGLLAPCHHTHPVPSVVGHGTPSWVRKQLGYNPTIADYRACMGIGWMNRDELSQAIPPAYTEFVGGQLLDHLAVVSS